MKTATVRKHLNAARKAQTTFDDLKGDRSAAGVRNVWNLACKADDAAGKALWAGECQTTMVAVMDECYKIKQWCDRELDWKHECYVMNLPKKKKKTWLDQVAC